MALGHLIIGNGIVAQYTALKLHQLGFSVRVVGEGVPFERFLLLHESGYRALEQVLPQVPAYPLQGIKAYWKGTIRWERPFYRWNLRLGTISYHRLWHLLAEELQQHRIPVLPHRIARIDEHQGQALTEDGQVLSANKIYLTVPHPEFVQRHPPVWSYVHPKDLWMGWVNQAGRHQWAYQWQNTEGYALLIPMHDRYVYVATDAAVARQLSQKCYVPVPQKWLPLKLRSHWYWQRQFDKIILVGDAARRMHPHTGLGLNDALRQLTHLPRYPTLSDRLRDLTLLLGGIILEACWGRKSWCIPWTYRMFALPALRQWFWA